MEIHVPKLGTVNYSEKEVIHFPEGLYGFETLKRYIHLQREVDSLFSYLQNIEDLNVTFILANPRNFIPDYILSVSENDLHKIKAKNGQSIRDYVIITVPEDVGKASANFLGPVVINEREHLGCQVISQNPEYTTKYHILPEVQTKAG